MKLLFFASITFALSFAPPSNGAIVVWGAAIDNGLSRADGSNLGVDNLVRVGTFNISDSVIQANAGDIAFLNSHFTEFGNARIGLGVQPNAINEHFLKTSDADSSSIVGSQIYIWALASSNNTSVGSSLASAFQLGIFYMDKSIDTAWAVPVQDPIPGTTEIDLTDLTNGSVLANGAHVVVGSFPDGTSDASGAPNFGLALTVPEPSTATAVIASVGLLALRRRRRS